MVSSMTGFGKSAVFVNGKKITIEIKSLNSKQLDLNVKIPAAYKEREFEIRNTISKELLRGKIDVFIYIETDNNLQIPNINTEIAKQYYSKLKNIEETLHLNPNCDYMSLLLRLPQVIDNAQEEIISDEEWNELNNGINDTIKKINDYRLQEGTALKIDFEKRINLIISYLDKVETFEADRIENIKAKLHSQLDTIISNLYDKNRFEQELIYYLEKIDFTEEKVRLRNHCSFFMQTLNDEVSQGKQLGFITQEIGREINTMGSKANEANIQQLVVKMKDELEKIREQLANIL
ncbi:MAG: YicC family protein [Bacteroidales bacterium]|jgi:uncharacterized protein (TIGR00255 family)|nr:YicC family protein [Bacteroidales bacterium]MDD2203758.1 YicC family protein [Bacteroidales bacterium]MDD3152897.1 YicC family protein [Bacteroidales bacterium]MDD3913303.1 YicC family protein [Bacteroidales bacterium]MDD4633334.1 YicC family protein [Bacteroidales bacterium]